MTIRIEYAGQLAAKADQLPRQLETTEPLSIAEAVGRVLKQSDGAARAMLANEDGSFRRGLIVIVNDQQVEIDDARTLQDGDILTCMSLIAGG